MVLFCVCVCVCVRVRVCVCACGLDSTSLRQLIKNGRQSLETNPGTLRVRALTTAWSGPISNAGLGLEPQLSISHSYHSNQARDAGEAYAGVRPFRLKVSFFNIFLVVMCTIGYLLATMIEMAVRFIRDICWCPY